MVIRTRGTAALPPGAIGSLAIGALIGVAIGAVDAARPEISRRFLPSSIGMGVALIVPFLYSFTIFVGALLLVIVRSRRPAWAATFAVAIGAGAIAGEGITGILAALANLLSPLLAGLGDVMLAPLAALANLLS
ncbi:OPT/YSL family transporter [Myxococcota bacterium]